MPGRDKDQEAFLQEELGKESPRLTRFVNEMLDTQRRILRELETIKRERLSDKQLLERLTRAFPDNDLDGHRRYHEALIESNEEKRKLRKAIQEKTISGLVWAGIVWFVTTAWKHLPEIITWGSSK